MHGEQNGQRGAGRRALRDDARARFAARAREELLCRLEWLSFVPERILDLGAAAGHGAHALKARYPKAAVLAVDRSFAMLKAAGRQSHWWRRFARICAQPSQLPLCDGTVDLVCSNLLLAFTEDPAQVLAEVLRVLAPRGCFSFSTLGPGTGAELLAALQATEAPRAFLPLPVLAARLTECGFADPVLDVDRHRLHFPSVSALLHEAAATARGALAGPVKPHPAARLKALALAYDRAREAEGLPLTVEVIYAQAWRPGARPPQRARRGEVVVDFIKRKR